MLIFTSIFYKPYKNKCYASNFLNFFYTSMSILYISMIIFLC